VNAPNNHLHASIDSSPTSTSESKPIQAYSIESNNADALPSAAVGHDASLSSGALNLNRQPRRREGLSTTQSQPVARAAGAEQSLVDLPTWNAILDAVQKKHPTLYRIWFKELQPRQLTNGVIQVTTPTIAHLNHCQTQLQLPFTQAAQEITGRLVAVSFHCNQLNKGGVFGEVEQIIPLNPDSTFEHYVIGPCNRLANAAAVAVGDQPGKAYNPLFIHGHSGLGKTHLLHATCQRILEKQPDARILFISCDDFVNQFITSVSDGEMNNFRNRYRMADVLVIDDIHFLRKHGRTQEEFFHTFNTLQRQGKQIILSADCAPNELSEIEARLVSRFNGGLVARIDKPCYETRVAILKRKAVLRNLAIPDEVICYVAQRIESNTRELEGAINQLQGMTSLVGGTLDLELARRALGEAEAKPERRISIQQIMDAVSRFYNVKLADLTGKRRLASIAFPRQVCMYYARKHTRYSLEEIGVYIGGRDHTTILHGIRTIEARLKNDPEVVQQLAQIDAAIGQ
jgi:chromosomal replication initiator protein